MNWKTEGEGVYFPISFLIRRSIQEVGLFGREQYFSIIVKVNREQSRPCLFTFAWPEVKQPIHRHFCTA